MKQKVISIITLIFILSAWFVNAQTNEKTGAASDEIKSIKSQAREVITDYNRTAEEVKYEAIKNNKNLSPEVKKTIIDLENKVSQLEEKIDNINYQNNETWVKFREELKNDISYIRKGIKSLSENQG